MNKTSYHRFSGLLSAAALVVAATITGYAQERPKPTGQKDGINLYIRFTEPLDPGNPKLVCELENTTDKPVPFQLQGAAEGPGLELHLFDQDGKEIEKTAEWIRQYETGDSMHLRYGSLAPLGDIAYRYDINLEKAYGRNWSRGTRLDVLWNAREKRTGPGPFGGQFGIGSGLRGSFDITPLTRMKFKSPPALPETGNSGNPAHYQAGSDAGASQPDSSPSTHGTASKADLTIWLFGGALLLCAVLVLMKWIIRKRRKIQGTGL